MTIATIARYEPPQELFAETYQGAPLLTKNARVDTDYIGRAFDDLHKLSPHNVFERLSHIQNTRVPNQNKEEKSGGRPDYTTRSSPNIQELLDRYNRTAMIRFPQLKKDGTREIFNFLEEYAKTHINKKREADTPGTVSCLMGVVSEETAPNCAKSIIKHFHKDLFIPVFNGQSNARSIQEEMEGMGIKPVEKSDINSLVNVEKLITDGILPENAVDEDMSLKGTKGLAMFRGMMRLWMLEKIKKIDEETMILFSDSDYRFPEEEWNTALSLIAFGKYAAQANNLHFPFFQMAKSGSGRNNDGTHLAIQFALQKALREKNREGYVGETAMAFQRIVWPHSDSYAIQWKELKEFVVPNGMEIEHVFGLQKAIQEAVRRKILVLQILNENPKQEVAPSLEEREMNMMGNLANHLNSLFEILLHPPQGIHCIDENGHFTNDFLRYTNQYLSSEPISPVSYVSRKDNEMRPAHTSISESGYLLPPIKFFEENPDYLQKHETSSI